MLGPQLKAKEAERAELATKFAALEGGAEKLQEETPDEIVIDEEAVTKLRGEIEEVDEALENLVELLTTATESETKLQAKLEEAKVSQNTKGKRLAFLQPRAGDTKLLPMGDRLRLVYAENNETVESLPNEMPLYRNRRYYALGLEALLAYYGLDDEAVTIAEDSMHLQVMSRDGKEELVNAPMTEGQFLEVNWFSKWSEKIPEVETMREAKRLHAEEKHQEYVALAPEIIRGFLSRVKDTKVPEEDAKLPQVLEKLGVGKANATFAKLFIMAAAGDLPAVEAPSYKRLLGLVEAIEYYFMPVALKSSHNPMCGMRDILMYDGFFNQVTDKIEEIEDQIQLLQQSSFVEQQVQGYLEQNPEHRSIESQVRSQFEAGIPKAIEANQAKLNEQLEELARIEEFFAEFENAIVFIGPEEKTFQDLAPTPFDSSAVPKVSMHGNLVKTLTSGFYLERLPDWIDHVITLGFCVLLAFFAVYSGPKASLVQTMGVVLQVAYVLVAFLMFSKTHVIWPVVAPAGAGLSTTFVGLGVMLVIEQKAKGRLKGMFGSYVSSDLVEQMVESGEEPSLGGEETKITAYFSDVQAFSSFSELLSPTGLVDLMNEYLTAMTNILQEERGTLDKYIGDAIVAMYGAPIPMEDHAYQAVRTALLMQRRQIELREKWASEGDKWPDIVSMMQTRIGCNTGTATVGNMGALDRFNYTMMGDMVNLAARCESGAKSYGAYIMITEETMEAALETQDDIAYRFMDKSVVKGRTQPVGMYEPTGFKKDLTQETEDCLDCFQQGIDKYLAQDWNGALKMFKKAQDLEPNKPGVTPGVKDNPSMILIDRCEVMKDNPPGDDWDGVFVMTSK